MAPRTVTPPPNLAGKVAIVTGSNSGIGYATASDLASLSCHVVMACRNAEKAQTALDSIKKTHPNASMEVMPLDLASLQSARDFAQSWQNQHGGKKVDLLICNGGATFVDLEKTGDGFERTYQTNYLTHFLLIRLMLPYLSQAEAPRIVFVSSNAASWGKVSMDNMNCETMPEASWKGMTRFKTGMQVYGNSKLMQMLSVIQFQKFLLSSPHEEEHKIAIHAVYPVAKKDHYGIPKFMTTVMDKVIKLSGTSIDNGAKPSLWAALSEEAGKKENWGSYWNDKAVKTNWPNAACKDGDLMKELWERSCKDAGVLEEL